MPPKRQKDDPKAQLSPEQLEQISNARLKANATRTENSIIRKAEKKVQAEEKKREKESRLKKAQEILGNTKGESSPTPEPNESDVSSSGPGIDNHEEPEIDVNEPAKPAPQKASKPQKIPKKPKDEYYEEKLKLLRQKQSKPEPQPEPQPVQKVEPEVKNDDLDVMTRNRLAYQMGQEQRKQFWRTHMGNEDFPDTYY